MGRRQMPAKHLSFPAVVEADHVITMNGSTDRHSRCSWSFGFGGWFSKIGEGLMNSRDQRRQLIRLDLIASNISADDFRGEFVGCSSGIAWSPSFSTGNNIPTPVNFRRANEDPPYRRRPDHPFLVPPALRQDPTGLSRMNSTWEVERRSTAVIFLCCRPARRMVSPWPQSQSD